MMVTHRISRLKGDNDANLLFTQGSTDRVGIGTNTPLAKLDIRGTLGTTTVASVSGNTSRAAFLVDNNGVGDLFTASKSGARKFVINNQGYLGLGGANADTTNYISAANFAVQNDGQVYTTGLNNYSSGNNAYINLALTGTTIQRNVADANAALIVQQLNASSTGDILQLANSAGTVLKVTRGGSLGLGATTPLATFDVRGNSGTTPVASVSGLTSMAALVVNNNGVGDLFTASKSGLPKFTIKNNGRVEIGQQVTNPSSNDTLTIKNIAGSNTDFSMEDGNGVNRWTWFANTSGVTGFYDASNALTPFYIEEGAGNNSITIDSTGNVGIGVANATQALELSSGKIIQMNSGQIQDYGDITMKLDADNNGSNDFEILNGGSTSVFKVTEAGVVTITDGSGNGFSFDPATGPTYSGTARPPRKVTLSAEYPGAILTASGSATTNGLMTSDASPSAATLARFMNYYEWNSSQTSYQDYTVAVKVTLPDDFVAWETSNAIQIYYNTEAGTNTSNKLDVRIQNADIGLTLAEYSTPVALRTNQNTSSKAWTAISIDDSEIDRGVNQDLDIAGDTAIIFLKMYSKDNNYVQVGDIILNYRSNK